MSSPDDDPLANDLRELMQRVDPVPEHVTAAARAALGWRRVDAELAELLADSALEPEPAGTRGPRQARHLAFRAPGLELDVEVLVEADLARLLGQLAPAGPATVEARLEDGTAVATAEADELGRFRLRLPTGVRLRLHVSTGDRAVETSWITI